MSTTSPRRARITLDAEAYTEQAWFQAEADRIFARMWLAVGRAAELDRPGAFFTRDIANASVLVLRGADGRIQALHNVCRHRGTRLCVTDAGVLPGSIQCPYHAWTYGLDGALLAAPQMDDAPGFDKADYPLRRVACEEWDGHLFINLSDSPAPLLDQIRGLPERFASWRMQDLRLAHRIQYDVATNWKLVVQNYNECLHCPVIHPLLNRMHHYLGAANVPSTETYCGGAMGFRDGIETLSSDGKRRRAVLPGLGAADQQLVNYFAIYPNFLLTLHPDYMMTITIWPHSPGRTKLIAEWHFHPDEMAKPGFVFEDAIAFWDWTNREDWAISEQSYRGISSRGYQPGPYSAREQQLWEFDQFVMKAVKHEGHEGDAT